MCILLLNNKIIQVVTLHVMFYNGYAYWIVDIFMIFATFLCLRRNRNKKDRNI